MKSTEGSMKKGPVEWTPERRAKLSATLRRKAIQKKRLATRARLVKERSASASASASTEQVKKKKDAKPIVQWDLNRKDPVHRRVLEYEHLSFSITTLFKQINDEDVKKDLLAKLIFV